MAEGFDDLRRHCQQCRDEACFCRRYLQSYDAWARRLPLQPGAWDESLPAWSNTWLWNKLQDGRLRWICQVCQEVETNMGANSSVNMYALTKHHESCAHHRSLTKLLGCAPPDVAPPAELFSEVLRQLQNGLDLSSGFAAPVGRVSAEKAKAMMWCLSEASLQMTAEVIAAATCMNISRNERHGRLHCRYRCVSNDFSFSCGGSLEITLRIRLASAAQRNGSLRSSV
jgi:hypothetical protein